MDVRVGVIYTPKELVIELGDDADGEALVASIEAALGDESAVLWLTDRKGRRVGVPSNKVAYIELGSPAEARVGFGAR